MMYKKCVLLSPKEKEDELGNIIADGWSIVKSCDARFSPWSVEDISLYGSEYTRNTSKYALPVSRKELHGVDSVLIEGVKLSIESKQELSPRWVVIHVRTHRNES